MIRLVLISPAVLASVLLLGCGELQTTSLGPTGNPLEARTSNNPDGLGAFVVHLRGTGAGFGNCDEGADICYFLGFSTEEWAQACASPDGLPGPSGEGLRIEHFRPDGSIHVLDHSKTEPLLVWDAPADFCADQPIAIGTGDFIGRDNDLTFTGNRANTFGFKVQGTVTALIDEQRYRLTNTFHATADRSGDLKVDRYEFDFSPIGR